MPDPVIAAAKPSLTKLEEGRAYFWCACGKSARQPFCDGSHKGTGIEPLRFTAPRTEETLLCACKRTKSPPFCDGSHNALQGGYRTDAESGAETPIIDRDGDHHPTSWLDGGCFVRTLDPARALRRGALALTPAITAKDGAGLLSVFEARLMKGASDSFAFPDADIVAFVTRGAPAFHVNGERCETKPETGVLILNGESLRLENPHEDEAVVFLTVCPARTEPLWNPKGEIRQDAPRRRAFGVDPALREPMADRFYQVLNGPENGSREITQFIGEIPQSRAEPHQHLYEEAIIILSGEGFMRTQTKRAAVAPGDVIFLPRKQVHALECASPEGMRLMGAFYPAGSPALNY